MHVSYACIVTRSLVSWLSYIYTCTSMPKQVTNKQCSQSAHLPVDLNRVTAAVCIGVHVIMLRNK